MRASGCLWTWRKCLNILLLTWNGCYNGQTCGHGNQAGGKISEGVHDGFDEVGVGLGDEVAKFQITAVTTTPEDENI